MSFGSTPLSVFVICCSQFLYDFAVSSALNSTQASVVGLRQDSTND